MDLHQLRCFVAVAEELHFGKAAARVDMLPSALGRHIRLLEEDLRTRLLARTTRSVTLTQEGAIFLDEARTLADSTESGGEPCQTVPGARANESGDAESRRD